MRIKHSYVAPEGNTKDLFICGINYAARQLPEIFSNKKWLIVLSTARTIKHQFTAQILLLLTSKNTNYFKR